MPDPGKLIFLVDDDLSVRRGLGALLAAAGYTVRTFDSSRAFLTWCKPGTTGCLVCDIVMPAPNGFDLVDTIRSQSPALSVIFVTAHDAPEIRRKADACKPVAYFRKPVDGDELIAALERACPDGK